MTERANSEKCPFGQRKILLRCFSVENKCSWLSSSIPDETPAPGRCVSLRSNDLGNPKAKANPVKLCRAESVVLSSLMTHTFAQLYCRSNQKANDRDLQSPLETGPAREKHCVRGRAGACSARHKCRLSGADFHGRLSSSETCLPLFLMKQTDTSSSVL